MSCGRATPRAVKLYSVSNGRLQIQDGVAPVARHEEKVACLLRERERAVTQLELAPFAPAAAICNVPVCIDQQCDWIADAIDFVRTRGLKSIQPSAETEEAWMTHHRAVSENTMIGRNKNSWYRREDPDGTKRELIAYLGGIPNYRRTCDAMKDSGYQGFELV